MPAKIPAKLLIVVEGFVVSVSASIFAAFVANAFNFIGSQSLQSTKSRSGSSVSIFGKVAVICGNNGAAAAKICAVGFSFATLLASDAFI